MLQVPSGNITCLLPRHRCRHQRCVWTGGLKKCMSQNLTSRLPDRHECMLLANAQATENHVHLRHTAPTVHWTPSSRRARPHSEGIPTQLSHFWSPHTSSVLGFGSKGARFPGPLMLPHSSPSSCPLQTQDPGGEPPSLEAPSQGEVAEDGLCWDLHAW